MLINFIGSPASGKTTTAAKIFASLKEFGIPCDFIPEQARSYIAQKRFIAKLKPNDPLTLDDLDQATILNSQYAINLAMVSVNQKDMILINDSSPLNALLYMTHTMKNNPQIQKEAHNSAKIIDLVFYCPPIDSPTYLDPNRIHSKEQSLKIDASIPFVLSEYEIWSKFYTLEGTPHQRMTTAIEHILSQKP